MTNNEKIYMLNALWFKPEGGSESYQKYMDGCAPILKKYGIRPLPAFAPNKSVIGKFDADLVFFVEYPSWDTFKAFTNDPDYLAILHFREEAITDSLLIRCSRVM